MIAEYTRTMNDVLSENIRHLTDWLMNEALVTEDYVKLYGQFHDRLRDAGVPIFRVQVGMPTLHPLAETITLTWRAGEPLKHELLAHGNRKTEGWLQSPVRALLDEGLRFKRFGPDKIAAAAKQFPVLASLQREGATDYVMFAIPFMDPDIAFTNRNGLIASYATDQAGGFTDDEMEAIQRILPRFSLVAKLANKERLFQNILDAYLGADAGRHVRAGQINLGSGQLIEAVIWFSDLRSSTALAEELGHEGFLNILNDYFAALAGAVVANDGAVLRFIGDAALAIFPISDDAFDADTARAKALAAAHEAVARAADINAARIARNCLPFQFGIGLHVGQIMYGNIGIPERVEFSVIGAAANEAARIEDLSKSLGHNVVVSEDFSISMDEAWQDLGHHVLKGSQKAIQLYTLASLKASE